MTILEKQRAIIEYCSSRSCGDCPLLRAPENCIDDEVIERNYEILFDHKE